MTNEQAKEIIIEERDSMRANPMLIVEDCLYEAYDMAIKALEQQPKAGHWILLANELYMCSECYAKWTMRLNYCPDCGARMAESEGDK